MKIRQVLAQCFHADRKKDRHLTKLIVDFRRHSNFLFIFSVICNTDSSDTDMTHSQFYPQHPTAVSSPHSSKTHKPTI